MAAAQEEADVAYMCLVTYQLPHKPYYVMRSVSNNYIRPLQQREINDRETAVHERRPTAEARTERKSKDAVINQLFELFRSFSPNLCPPSPPYTPFSPVNSCICYLRNTKLRDRG